MSISRFFIDRPVFASVLAILLMLAGTAACLRMPINQFPQLAPPTISMVIDYSGASAQTMQDNVAQIIEQRMTGLDKLLYITTNSSSEGRCRLALTFEPGTDANIALMQVQNCLDLAMPSLPDTVKSQGIRVRKVSDTFMRFYSLYDKNNVIPVEDIADFASSTLVDPISRIDGVGDTTLFGSSYAMRIWLNPNKLLSYSLTPNDVVAAIRDQNKQISVGQLGSLPAVAGQEINVTLLSRVKLQTVEQFRNILVRINPDGSTVRVSDVARVEMGRQGYAINSRFNGTPAATIGIQLAEGANAVATAERVDEFMHRMEQFFPAGLTYSIAGDTIPFIQASISNVAHTLIEAVLLVSLIMFLFLQNWRATLIPAMAVPIVLLGTMAVMGATGSSINTLSMFGLVLAIGLLVDDAIVVVENTERIMQTEGLSAADAIRRSMDQITWALLGVAAVLSAVFIPMSFFGGIPGAIYREFSLTIVSAMVLSVFVAVIVTPPMCACLLKKEETRQSGFFGGMNRLVDAATNAYAHILRRLINNSGKVMIVYVLLVCCTVWALEKMPRSFLPVEDQGIVNVNIFATPGSTSEATEAIVREVEEYFQKEEGGIVEAVGMMLGMGPYGSRGQNVATGYVKLKHWDDRPDQNQSATAIVSRARAHFANDPRARILFSEPPQVRGLGSASGIVLQLEDQGGLGYDALVQARTQLLELAASNPLLFNTRTSSLGDIPQLRLVIDDLKAGTFRLSADAINDNLSTAWGGTYVNDFVDRGRVKRVYVQGDAPFRMNTDDLSYWHFRNADGGMVPLDAVATLEWTFGPSQLERFNGVPSTIIESSPAHGVSSGDAMDEIERLVREELPQGIGLEWTGLSFEEHRAGGQASILYAISILVVFLCLAAMYESWSIPMAVILVVPIGVLGALGLSSLRGLYNDIYFQVGILAVIGLSAKNAILIVEFARSLVRQGKSFKAAAITAASMRLRPIVMTSLAFLLGVLPLTVTHGAGASSQHAIGTGIIGGTFLATALGIFFTPVFFVFISRLFSRKKKTAADAALPKDDTLPCSGGSSQAAPGAAKGTAGRHFPALLQKMAELVKKCR